MHLDGAEDGAEQGHHDLAVEAVLSTQQAVQLRRHRHEGQVALRRRVRNLGEGLRRGRVHCQISGVGEGL